MVWRVLSATPASILLLLWVAANLALFAYTFWQFASWDQYFYTRKTVGYAIVLARAGAAPLKLNLALILLPVCRNVLSLLRGSCKNCSQTSLVCRQLDHNISFHKLCAYAICFWTGVHYFAHTFNFQWLVDAATTRDYSGLLYKLSRLPDEPNGTWFNPIRSNDTNSMLAVASSLAGTTGILATLILVVMVSSSMPIIRRSFFEVFWFTHHFFIVFFLLLIAHDQGGLGRSMTNLAEHNLTYCAVRWPVWDIDPRCPDPQFASRSGQTWMWVIGPLVLYLIERLIRLARRFQTIEVLKVVQYPAKVLELRLRRAGFTMSAGQYVVINCPQVSLLEWHPFTLTSAPEEADREHSFSVHIRQAGDWTEAVSKACEAAQGNMAALPKFSVDGPFGTCSDDVFKYEVAMLVGAGIGVTPFASILKHIWYMHSSGRRPRLTKVYFCWVCPETSAFSWFVDLLKSLEQQVAASPNPDFLDIQIYWTRGWTQSQRHVLIDAHGKPADTITGLEHKTKFGRPPWDSIFGEVKDRHQGARVGVFFCGPSVMSKTLERTCVAHSSGNPRETSFVYNKENF